jgi:hypothetical protein
MLEELRQALSVPLAELRRQVAMPAGKGAGTGKGAESPESDYPLLDDMGAQVTGAPPFF